MRAGVVNRDDKLDHGVRVAMSVSVCVSDRCARRVIKNKEEPERKETRVKGRTVQLKQSLAECEAAGNIARRAKSDRSSSNAGKDQKQVQLGRN